MCKQPKELRRAVFGGFRVGEVTTCLMRITQAVVVHMGATHTISTCDDMCSNKLQISVWSAIYMYTVA